MLTVLRTIFCIFCEIINNDHVKYQHIHVYDFSTHFFSYNLSSSFHPLSRIIYIIIYYIYQNENKSSRDTIFLDKQTCEKPKKSFFSGNNN